MSNSKEQGYVYIQPRINNIDIYRITPNPGVIKQETFNSKQTEGELENRFSASLKNEKESEIFLGLSVAILAMLFIESLRSRSKLLTTATLGSSLLTYYLNKERKHHKNESQWIEKEIIALEEYKDKDLIFN